ncbi:BLUF domain-containing protein [Ulvibacterium sp.]|uniref:BLUF domain-containing protein n=1 Tax=Ulvibacterium sp. TaxID=2665914 RepID=UPI003BAA4D3C
MPYQITYRSEAVCDVTDSIISDILEISKRNNAKLDITGCLIYKENFFLQILEGEEDLVRKLYFTIKGDTRHENVETLHEGHSEERMFTKWDMAYARLNGKEGDAGKDLALINYEFDRLKNEQANESFTYRVFWYNVKRLVSKEGFYSWEKSNLA